MRIEELYLEGFGHFHQRTIGPVSGPVAVFYGPNEAGKSTTLAFIRAILFGFPARFNSHYPPLSGGRHGGRIALRDDAGEPYQVERYAGTRGGLSVTISGGPVSNAGALMQRLTGNAPSDMFRNVFAFSLDELQIASSLNDSNGAIYSAVQGAPGLPALRRSLGDHKGQIYLNRGSNQEVPRLLNALKDVDTQLRAVEGNAGRFGQLTARRSEIGRELEEADAELGKLAFQRGEIQRLLDGWEDWLGFSDSESQLRELPEFAEFPEDAIARLENLEGRIQLAKETRDEIAIQLRRLVEAAEATIDDEDLLYDAARMETIRRDRNRFDSAVKDLPERRAELGALESELQDRLRDLGPEWGEGRLQEFDASLAFRQEVEQAKDSLAERQDSVRRAEQRLEQEQRALADCQTAVTEAQDRMPADPPPLNAAALGQQRAALRDARNRLDEFERARRSHEDLRYLLDSTGAKPEPDAPKSPLPMLAAILLGIVGVAMIGAGAFVGGGGLLMGLVAGLALLAAAVYVALQRRSAPAPAANPMSAPLSRRSTEAEDYARSAWGLLVDAASTLAIGGEPTSAALDNAEERLGAAQAALANWNTARERLEEAQRHHRAQEQRVETAESGLKAASVSYSDARLEWGSWLERHELPASFTPDTVIEFAGRVETARVKLEQVRDNRRRVGAIENDILEFRSLMRPLADRHGLSLDDEDDRQLAPAADELIGRVGDAQVAYSDRERAQEQVEDIQQQLKIRDDRLVSAKEAYGELLKAGGTDDTEEFRRRARQQTERLELERRREQHRRSLVRLSGPGDKFDTFRKALATADPNRLSEEFSQLMELQAEVDFRRNGLREERGGIDTELAQLTSEEESSELRIRRNTLEEQLREHAREWSRLTIAEALLDKTRQKFEEERQPSVIRHAQGFFSAVTGQRYQRLFAPIGEQTVTVTDASGGSKRPEELSRGTREQLYLSLRFGLIREFGEHAERLPVVVDEALVNFDPERARLAAEAFAQLSETNQVLVFTCHPSTAEMFADAAGAQVIDISS